MKRSEKIGYVLGILIGSLFWLSLIGYSLFELIRRLLDGDDIFPVLTTLMSIAIISKLGIIDKSFRSVLEWINK